MKWKLSDHRLAGPPVSKVGYGRRGRRPHRGCGVFRENAGGGPPVAGEDPGAASPGRAPLTGETGPGLSPCRASSRSKGALRPARADHLFIPPDPNHLWQRTVRPAGAGSVVNKVRRWLGAPWQTRRLPPGLRPTSTAGSTRWDYDTAENRWVVELLSGSAGPNGGRRRPRSSPTQRTGDLAGTGPG